VLSGERPGEYCPGRWSLHLVGGPKVVGAAQRSISGASVYTAVVVVEGGEAIRRTLLEVYAALEVEWDATTAGSVSDRVPHLDVSTVGTSIVQALGPVVVSSPNPEVVAAGIELRDQHDAEQRLQGSRT
jgi:octanoyl-[GcvH]:protein N-octanoyltransferase